MSTVCSGVGRNSTSGPSPGTEAQLPFPFSLLPPSILGTPDPAHLGLPEHLASVTVPIRLDALSYLLHSALLGVYSLQQASPCCPCSPQAGQPQPCTGWRAPRGRGAWEGPRRPARGQGPWRSGPGRATLRESSRAMGLGAGRTVPRMTPASPPTLLVQEGRKEAGDPEPPPTAQPPAATEDWEADY
ncbi:piRNA-mediated silencing protein C19orf84 homolog [Ctenodactylus gundi]